MPDALIRSQVVFKGRELMTSLIGIIGATIGAAH